METNPSALSALLKHKFVVYALGAVAVIAAGSAVYYIAESGKPTAPSLSADATSTSGDIAANGVVEPVENPDLSFEVGGRIIYIRVAVGDTVYQGETLASLDTSTLLAARAQAQADEKTQEAKLNELTSGPRQTDIAVKQAAVSQAVQTKAALYAGLPSAISAAYASAVDAVHAAADPLFSNPNTASPTLVFTTTDGSVASAAASGRTMAGSELSTWNIELSAMPSSPSDQDLNAALDAALRHLAVIRSFEDTLISALNTAVPSSSFTSSSVTAAQTSLAAARGTVNGLISSLTASKQGIVSDELAVESAQAELDQLLAGASPQNIEAQQAAVDRAKAVVSGIDAQISQNLIIAPFSGVVGSVPIKVGQIAVPNTPAITLVPDSALDVSVYVTEIDVTRIKAGDAADVTLDAYGSGRVFPAHVSVVDQAPSQVNGVSAYKVTLAFDAPDPSVKTGMTANAAIHPGTASVNHK